VKQESSTCCYAVADKTWVKDPTGIAWETFFTHGTSTKYGESDARDDLQTAQKPQSAQVGNSHGSCC